MSTGSKQNLNRSLMNTERKSNTLREKSELLRRGSCIAIKQILLYYYNMRSIK